MQQAEGATPSPAAEPHQDKGFLVGNRNTPSQTVFRIPADLKSPEEVVPGGT